MAKTTKKTTKRKRTALKDLPAKSKEVTKKEGQRVKGGGRGKTLTINGIPFSD